MSLSKDKSNKWSSICFDEFIANNNHIGLEEIHSPKLERYKKAYSADQIEQTKFGLSDLNSTIIASSCNKVLFKKKSYSLSNFESISSKTTPIESSHTIDSTSDDLINLFDEKHTFSREQESRAQIVKRSLSNSSIDSSSSWVSVKRFKNSPQFSDDDSPASFTSENDEYVLKLCASSDDDLMVEARISEKEESACRKRRALVDLNTSQAKKVTSEKVHMQKLNEPVKKSPYVWNKAYDGTYSTQFTDLDDIPLPVSAPIQSSPKNKRNQVSYGDLYRTPVRGSNKENATATFSRRMQQSATNRASMQPLMNSNVAPFANLAQAYTQSSAQNQNQNHTQRYAQLSNQLYSSYLQYCSSVNNYLPQNNHLPR